MVRVVHEIPWSPGSCFVIVLIIYGCYFLSLPYSCSAGEIMNFNCSEDGNYSSASKYQQNLNALLINMVSESKSSKLAFYNHTEGTGSDQVYGSYLCQGELPAQNCSDCVEQAFERILKCCPTQKVAKIWYDNCIFEFSDEPFFGEWIYDYVVWCEYQYKSEPSHAAEFNKVLNDTLTKVAQQAATDTTPGLKFSTMEVDLPFEFNGSSTLYMLAQCIPTLSPDVCLQCLYEGMSTDWLLKFCTKYGGGRFISSSCTMRYQITRFYGSVVAAPPLVSQPIVSPYPKGRDLIPPAGPGHSGNRSSRILVIVSIIASVVMALTLGTWCYLRNRKALDDFEGIDMEEITIAESLQMDFNTVRAATQNFAPDKKLGEGGFGDVFKGKLENGQEIAVKRLTTTNSGQGALEFKNEVVLVAKLQHRNLVKLLGFCLSGKEKILVYEYLPNSSLDKVLFDPIKRASLAWEKRFNIICGIAKGLLYLHEDSRLRIIHRDLKSSNILLDEAMNPKISDFGIAKTLGLDQTRASTGVIAGTYGYMAPEYVLTGQYSLKSDIYSFGIMVLEIVTGQRNRFDGRPLLEEALLHRAWRLWNENAELEMVDYALNDAYSMEEVVKCIHIGLLCIQEDAGKRPKMTSVVAALSGKSTDLPAPTPPNFFNISRSILITSGSSTSATTSATTTTTGTTQSSLLPTHVDD